MTQPFAYKGDFDTFAAQVRKESEPRIERLARILTELGHTDSVIVQQQQNQRGEKHAETHDT